MKGHQNTGSEMVGSDGTPIPVGEWEAVNKKDDGIKMVTPSAYDHYEDRIVDKDGKPMRMRIVDKDGKPMRVRLFGRTPPESILVYCGDKLVRATLDGHQYVCVCGHTLEVVW